jgi:hypothetical protein
MKIFQLERHPAFVDWEELINITIIAQSHEEARMRAYVHVKEKGYGSYAHELLDPKKCTCKVIPFSTGVIAEEFKSA